MSDAELKLAIAELQEVVRCRCNEAYRDRGLKDPHCECDSAEAVKVVADHIKALTVESARRLALARSEGVARVEQFERTEALTEQLAAARQDAKEAEAYAEELEKERDDYAHKLMQANNTYTEMHLEIERLSDKLATCEKYRDAYDEMGRIGTQAVRDLEAKLAKAVKGLDAVVQHEASTFFGPDGEKNKRASWRGVMRKVRATLAEIKGT